MTDVTTGRTRTPAWLDGGALIIACAAVLVIVAVTMTASAGLEQPMTAAAFGGLIALGEMVRLRLPDDRVQVPVALAGALGYALLFAYPTKIDGSDLAEHGVMQTVAVAAVAMLVGALPHVIAGRPSGLDGIARRVLAVAVVAAAFRTFALDPQMSPSLADNPTLLLVASVVAVALAWPSEALLAAGELAGRRISPFPARFHDELVAYLGIGAAMASTGVLIALSVREIGLWALPIITLPLLLAQFAYRRYGAIRRTQIQTIRSLSRSTEVGGYTATNHAQRVADIAMSVGRDLGIPENRIRLLQYAALMHDLGQLSLADPIPGGATVLLAPDERRRIAERSAEIVQQTGVPEEVAGIVEAQAEPYRRPHVPDDVEIPWESRIIKVANAYDDLVGSLPGDESRLDALETLRLGMAYEYDPQVVASLARVLERTGRL